MSDDYSDPRLLEDQPLAGREGDAHHPVFAVGKAKWIITAAMVSMAAGILILVAMSLAAIFTGDVTLRLAAGAVGALLGILGGNRLAMKMTDVAASLAMHTSMTVGAVAALIAGVMVPYWTRLWDPWPLIAFASPGLGAVAGQAALNKWRKINAPPPPPPPRRRGPYGDIIDE